MNEQFNISRENKMAIRKDKLKKGLGVKHENIGPYKPVKHHRKKASQRKYSPAANRQIHKEIRKFEEGKLHSGSKHGPEVKNLRQAVAIGISEAKRKGEKAGEHWKKSRRSAKKK